MTTSRIPRAMRLNTSVLCVVGAAMITACTCADAVVSPAGFTVMFPNRRKPFDYLPSLAPGVIASLRALAPGGRLDRPFHVDADSLSRAAPFTSGSRWLWVARAEDRITIASREAAAGVDLPHEPEPIEPWRPAKKVYACFPDGRVCGHCQTTFTRFRVLGEALMCSGCGRSEKLSPEDLDGVAKEAKGRHEAE